MAKVSICTPTFNRRPFINNIIQCILHQDYPKELIEWIVVDDGTDKIEDLVTKVDGIVVKYFRIDKKMSLGTKRNFCHTKCTGDYIIYMDDDDYYPPTRISYAVSELKKSDKLIAGSSEVYVWFKTINKMIQFGPYRENHCTAGTMAFKKELLKQTRYDETSEIAEEKHFLKDYTIPVLQLDPLHVILVFSHSHNTFDKSKLLKSPNKFMKDSDKTVDDFIKEPARKQFFLEQIDQLLDKYDPGLPIHKPAIILKMLEMEEGRRIKLQDKLKSMVETGANGTFTMKATDGSLTTLTNVQIIKVVTDLQKSNQTLIKMIKDKDILLKDYVKKLTSIEKILKNELLVDNNIQNEIVSNPSNDLLASINKKN